MVFKSYVLVLLLIIALVQVGHQADGSEIPQRNEKSISDIIFQKPMQIWQNMVGDYNSAVDIKSVMKGLPHRDDIKVTPDKIDEGSLKIDHYGNVELSAEGSSFEIHATLNALAAAPTATNNPCAKPYGKYARYVGFNNTLYYCNDTKVTKEYYEEHLNDTTLHCHSNETEIKTCICSLDRDNHQCSTLRKFTCEPKISSELPECEKPDWAKPRGGISMYGDFSCLEAKNTTSMDVNVSVSCKFLGPPQWETSLNGFQPNSLNFTDLVTNEVYNWTTLRQTFKYFLLFEENNVTLDSTFAMVQRIGRPIVVRPINFYSLSNEDDDLSLVLTKPTQYIGQENMTFHLDISKLENNTFFIGNRLRYEIGYRPWNPIVNKYARLTFNMVDRSEPPYSNLTQLILSITIPIAVTILVLILALIVGVYMFRQWRESKELSSFFD